MYNQGHQEGYCTLHSRYTGIANPAVLDLLKSLKFLWFEGILLAFGDLQKRILGNTGHAYRRVFSLLLWLEEIKKQREMPVHLYAYFASRSREHCIPLYCWNMARSMRMHEGLYSSVGRHGLSPLLLWHFLADSFLMHRRRRVVIPALRKMSGSNNLQRPHLRDLHKAWSLLDLDAQPGNLSPHVPS